MSGRILKLEAVIEPIIFLTVITIKMDVDTMTGIGTIIVIPIWGMIIASLTMGEMRISLAPMPAGMTEGMAVTVTGALQEIVIEIEITTAADAVDQGAVAGAMIAEVGAGAEVLSTGGDEAEAAVIRETGIDLAAATIHAILGEAPPIVIRSVPRRPRMVKIGLPWLICFRHLLRRLLLVLQT